jgi:hypothetical protein
MFLKTYTLNVSLDTFKDKIACPEQKNIGLECYPAIPGGCTKAGWCENFCGNAKCCKKNVVDPSGQCLLTEGGTSTYQCVANNECLGWKLLANTDDPAGYIGRFKISCSNYYTAKDRILLNPTESPLITITQHPKCILNPIAAKPLITIDQSQVQLTEIIFKDYLELFTRNSDLDLIECPLKDCKTMTENCAEDYKEDLINNTGFPFSAIRTKVKGYLLKICIRCTVWMNNKT